MPAESSSYLCVCGKERRCEGRRRMSVHKRCCAIKVQKCVFRSSQCPCLASPHNHLLNPESCLLHATHSTRNPESFVPNAPSLYPLLFVQLREASDALQPVLALALSLSFSQLFQLSSFLFFFFCVRCGPRSHFVCGKDFKLSFNIHTEPEPLYLPFLFPHKHCRTANSFNYTRV